VADGGDWSERSFDLVSDITKQVIALSAGIITFSVTFAHDFANHAGRAHILLAVSWAAYAVSVGFGCLTLMASAGVQSAKAGALAVPEAQRTTAQAAEAAATVFAPNIRWMGMLQLATFLVAIVLTAVAGVLAL
jgi:hypothetical protein